MKKKGEVYRFEIDDEEKEGSEQKGNRFAVVIQCDEANRNLDTTVIAYITGREAKPNGEVEIEPNEVSGLRKKSAVKVHQIWTVDQENSSFGRLIGEVDGTLMTEIELTLKTDIL